MTRRGSSRRGIALLACAFAAAGALPAAAGAQSAVDEYTLDIPGAGNGAPGASNGGGGGNPATAGAAGAGGDGGGKERSGSAGRTAGGKGSDGSGGGAQTDDLDELHSGGVGGSSPLDTSSRSAPEVIADSLLDGPMVPILVVLVVITGVGVWRVLRGRGMLSRQAG